jgi:Na+-transporting NADH:ubiquinone oxidoreductase subunit NqrF
MNLWLFAALLLWTVSMFMFGFAAGIDHMRNHILDVLTNQEVERSQFWDKLHRHLDDEQE